MQAPNTPLRDFVCAVKREIAALRAQLGVQKQLLESETSNPRSMLQVKEEYAQELAEAEADRARVEADEQAAYDAALSAGVVAQAVFTSIWGAVGNEHAGTGAASLLEQLRRLDGRVPWTATTREALQGDAEGGLQLLQEADIVTMLPEPDKLYVVWSEAVLQPAPAPPAPADDLDDCGAADTASSGDVAVVDEPEEF